MIKHILLLLALFATGVDVKACDEDDLTDYSVKHLLIVCKPGPFNTYEQNPYYKGDKLCGQKES